MDFFVLGYKYHEVIFVCKFYERHNNFFFDMIGILMVLLSDPVFTTLFFFFKANFFFASANIYLKVLNFFFLFEICANMKAHMQ